MFGSSEYTAVLFMKSGNIIRADRMIKTINYKYTGNVITELSDWQQHEKAKCFVAVQTIALDQIEAIAIERT